MIKIGSKIEKLILENASDIYYCEHYIPSDAPFTVSLSLEELATAVKFFEICETCYSNQYIVFFIHATGECEEIFFSSISIDAAKDQIELEEVTSLGHSKRITTRL